MYIYYLFFLASVCFRTKTFPKTELRTMLHSSNRLTSLGKLDEDLIDHLITVAMRHNEDSDETVFVAAVKCIVRQFGLGHSNLLSFASIYTFQTLKRTKLFLYLQNDKMQRT